VGTSAALVPGLEQHATEAGAWGDDLEHHLVLRQLFADREHLLRVAEHLLCGRVGRGLELIEQETLIFLGCEFGLGRHAEQDGRAEQQRAHDDDHAPGRECRPQQSLIAVAHALELAVDELHEAPAFLLAPEEARAHHRRQGQRDHRRDRHGACERETRTR